jgi:hypothetical protein
MPATALPWAIRLSEVHGEAVALPGRGLQMMYTGIDLLHIPEESRGRPARQSTPFNRRGVTGPTAGSWLISEATEV